MKIILMILITLTIVSCRDSNNITITKDEYSKLKGDSIVKKIIITFPEGSSASFDEWEIIQASDGHDYLENGGGHDQVLMHYIECNKCKKK